MSDTLPSLQGLHALASSQIVKGMNTNHAQWTQERLVKEIQEFEANLNDQQEIGAQLVSFGGGMTFHIEDIRYWGPDMIIFHGLTEQGERVQLVQHYTQLNVLFIAVKSKQEKGRRIGFLSARNNETVNT